MGWILPLILGLSLFLRLPFLDRVPPELFGDELDVGYQAFSLLHTGRDLYGQPLPLYLHSLSEWRLPLIVYQTVPAVRLFGLSETALRLPEVISGALSPVIIFLLVIELTRRRVPALMSALIITFLPWHFIYSRLGGFGAVTLLNYLMLGSLFFLKKKSLLSGLFFGLSLYIYPAALIFVTLWLTALKLATRLPVGKSALLTLAISAPLLYFSFLGPASARFNQLSVFQAQEVIDDITTYRGRNPGLLGRLFYNKPVVFARLITRNYLTAFSPEFLFLRGDPVGRHSLQVIGGLYGLLAPLIILGIYSAVRRREFLPLIWLGLAPLPSALTIDGGYHATRLFFMVAPLVILAAMGFDWFRRLGRFGPAFLVLLGLLALYSVPRAGYYYFVDYPQVSWRWWQYGYKDSLTALNRLAPDYSRIFINNSYEPALIRFLFWTAYPPQKFHASFSLDQPQKDILPGFDGFELENRYFFGQFSSPARQFGISPLLQPNALYLISQRDDVGGDWDWRTSPPAGVTVLHTTVNPQNTPLFYLVTRK